MNNQNLMLLAIGAFVALIVTVAAVDQFLLDEHPPTEVEGLIWRVENAFNRVRDLEATLQVTTEAHPTENVRMKVRYVKGPPPVFSMRYVSPPLDTNEQRFLAFVRDETFTVQNDQLIHHLPGEDIIVSKRWPGLPLVDIGLSVFDMTQMRMDWMAGKTEITIFQDITGFSGWPLAAPMSVIESFSHPTSVPFDLFPVEKLPSFPSYSLYFSFYPEFQEGAPPLSLSLIDSIGAEHGGSILGSYILEVRDAQTQDLSRMVWIDRETYLIQKVVTFKDGRRNASLLVQLITVNQGLTADDVITTPQAGVENIRG